MKLWFRRLPLVVAGLAIIWTVTTMVSQTQAPPRGAATPAAPATGRGTRRRRGTGPGGRCDDVSQSRCLF